MEIDGNMSPLLSSSLRLRLETRAYPHCASDRKGAAQSGICAIPETVRLGDGASRKGAPSRGYCGNERGTSVWRTGSACERLFGRTSSAHERERRALAIRAV